MDPATLAAIMSAMQGMKGEMSNFGSNLANVGYGLFGDAGAPYKKAGKELNKYLPWAQAYQNPFFQAGAGALPQFQEWLGGMKDPSQFINNMMGQYQESPWAKYQQQQAIRAGQNAGSASGLTGSTPLAQFMEQTAQGISSQDMQNWLQNVLGTNLQYGAGLGELVSGGRGSANTLTNLMSDYMTNKAKLRYNEERANQGQWGGLFSGLGHLMFG